MSKTVQGTLSTHFRGFGFVTPQKGGKTIFIPKTGIGSAVDGDTVVVTLTGESLKGPEGIIAEVIKRGRNTLVGTIIGHQGKYLVAYTPILGQGKHVNVRLSRHKLKIGDRLFMRVVQWENDSHATICETIEPLGHITDAMQDIPVAVREYNLRETFPEAAVLEARSFGKEVEPQEHEARLDLRELETVTIDPPDAKDYDDALSLIKENGHYILYVHIADVTHYVRPDSCLDREAKLRSNSTYFPGRCIPMLPEELSNELCSLQEGVERLAVTVTLRFNSAGDLQTFSIDRSRILSRKRFSYEEALAVLEGKRQSPHAGMLLLMVELCHLLKKKRAERGSVDLALPDIRLILGSDGVPTGYERVEYDITHQLVEEFMLKANEVVAFELIKRGQGGVFRIHEAPGPADFDEFFALAARLGYPLPKEPTQADIQDLFKAAQGTDHLVQLSVAFIRSMKLAIYSEENVGHFGLGLEHYCHFTSPIRRYSDLIVHRILMGNHVEDLKKIALHCSEQEAVSAKAESQVVLLKKLRWLHRLFEKEPKKIFEVEITKIKPFGLFFELPPLMIEGFIHISCLGNDYYEFFPEGQILQGENTGERFATADTLSVQLEEVDLITQEACWRIVKRAKRRV